MRGRYRVVGVLLVVLIGGGVGAVTYTDVGTETGTEPIVDDDIEELPTDTEPTETDENSEDEQPFTFTIDEIEDCSRTCRDVTATVENNQEEPATGVTISTTIYAGENTTAEADQIWDDTSEIGTIAAGDSHTATERVDLSLGDGYEVRQNDGWITIETTIDSAEETVTMRRTRDIS